MKGKVVGHSIPKVDAREKVTGQAKYATDLYMENMVHMKVLRAPYPHAIIRKIDISKALKVPGIIRIITKADLPELKNFGLIIKDQPALVGIGEKTRYLGDALALVIGEKESQVRKAIRLIDVEYDKLEVITDPLRAMEEDAPKIHENGNIVCVHKLDKGDIVKGFMEADLIVYNEFKTQHLDHVPLQPDAGMAVMDEDGTIRIWAATQWLHDTRVDVAQALGMPVEKIRIIQPTIGGAFGKREDVIAQLHLAIAAKMVKRPVKTIYSREESIISTSKRHPIIFRFKTGVKKDGTLTAWEATIIGDTGAYASSGPAVVHKGLYHCTGPYNVPNVRGVAYTVYTNNTYSGAMRGFGATQTAFAYESQMDIIAEKLGMNPIELRLKNAYQVGSTTPNGQVLYASVGVKETIIKAVEAFERQGGVIK
ncbi:aldehyde oxidase [Anoxybacter fermentans]|uniref:Aldehyde oxidase n=1 Tax=Anoxybacter fermentans TaxID=1323375 RepID=A0A3Q9HR01_9FIRM|nr:molybdopterin cofactor-binding domain-containing protein [Anoxybacter fermentans]AZR73599.1 aldehyde oxidase [Anoxybacter fermentans]